MITILLTILKIIGVILLVLLVLILLVLCLVLFAPVRYRAKGAKHPEEMDVSAFISYLNPLVRVRVSYPGEPVLSVKILWFDLLKPGEEKNGNKGRPKKKKNKKKSAQKQRAEKKASPEQTDRRKTPENQSAEKQAAQKQPTDEETAEKQSAEMSSNTKSKIVYSTETFREEDEVVSRKKSEKEKSTSQEKAAKEKADFRGKTDKEKAASQKSTKKDKSSSSGESKSKRPADDFDDPGDEKEENRLIAIAALLWQYKEMYPDVLGKVFGALKTILPRKCDIHLVFGTGSPETTGYLYGAYCALGEYLPGTVEFEPVWMESYLDVEFELSGKIRVIHFVTAAVKIIADKRVRHFISEIRRI